MMSNNVEADRFAWMMQFANEPSNFYIQWWVGMQKPKGHVSITWHKTWAASRMTLILSSSIGADSFVSDLKMEANSSSEAFK